MEAGTLRGLFTLFMFLAFPILFLLSVMDVTADEVVGSLVLGACFLSLLGLIWMLWIKCPSCGALLTQHPQETWPLPIPSWPKRSMIKTHCSKCGRSTLDPYPDRTEDKGD